MVKIVNPIYGSSINVDEKLKKCEYLFSKKGQKTVFKITPFVYPQNLEEHLQNKGYNKIRETSIQTMNININYKTNNDIKVFRSLNDEWFENCCKINNINEENSIIYKRILGNIIVDKIYILKYIKNKVIGCAMSVIEDSTMGIYSLAIDKEYRNKGYGYKLLKDLLFRGQESGVKKSYLQVMLNNTAAMHLYKKTGFKEIYKYHYMVK
jgi:ribosomal protein S18 acetylase RimI-like enzyme